MPHHRKCLLFALFIINEHLGHGKIGLHFKYRPNDIINHQVHSTSNSTHVNIYFVPN